MGIESKISKQRQRNIAWDIPSASKQHQFNLLSKISKNTLFLTLAADNKYKHTLNTFSIIIEKLLFFTRNITFNIYKFETTRLWILSSLCVHFNINNKVLCEGHRNIKVISSLIHLYYNLCKNSNIMIFQTQWFWLCVSEQQTIKNRHKTFFVICKNQIHLLQIWKPTINSYRPQPSLMKTMLVTTHHLSKRQIQPKTWSKICQK